MQQCDFVREPWIHDVEENGLSEVGEPAAVSYTHLRAHETVLDLVCRLLLEKKKHIIVDTHTTSRETTANS